MTTASLNYTGRKKIKQKQFSCTLADDTHSDYQLTVSIDKLILKSIDEDDSIVLDMILRAEHERFDLKRVENQTIYPKLFKPGSTPRYRLSIVDMHESNAGRIKLSSEEFKLGSSRIDPRPKPKKKVKPISVVRETQSPFFSPKESEDIGELPWKIEFYDSGEVQVLINSRLLNAFKGDKKNPILRAMIFPPMVRQIFEGLFLRLTSMDDLNGTDAEKWFKWADLILEKNIPKEDFVIEGGISEVWEEWLDDLIDEFVTRNSSTHGTLLANMEEFLDD